MKQGGVFSLAKTLKANASSIKKLDLALVSNYQTGAGGANDLADALKHCLKLKDLTLNLYNNKVKGDGAKNLCESIS